MPAGVVNLVTPVPTGPAIARMLQHPSVRKLSFTGSTEIGWQIKSKANKKMVTLELGGNAPVIVDESADFEHSLKQTTTGAFAYAGQVCISVQRVYIHEKLFDEWTGRFVENAKKLKKGNPLDEATEISSMITEEAAKNCLFRATQKMRAVLGDFT